MQSGHNYKQYFHKLCIPYLPDIPGDYDLAISFNDPHYIVGKKVSAKVRMSWFHTDASQMVFCDAIDGLELETLGPQFEYAELFPERINTEFVRVVNPTNLRIRVWERGNGETFACGTGACAAVVAAIRNGYCEKDTEITVRLKGGDLSVRYTQDGIFLTGSAVQVYEGEFEY